MKNHSFSLHKFCFELVKWTYLVILHWSAVLLVLTRLNFITIRFKAMNFGPQTEISCLMPKSTEHLACIKPKYTCINSLYSWMIILKKRKKNQQEDWLTSSSSTDRSISGFSMTPRSGSNISIFWSRSERILLILLFLSFILAISCCFFSYTLSNSLLKAFLMR